MTHVASTGSAKEIPNMQPERRKPPQILSILRALVQNPEAFASFLRYVPPTHLSCAWELAFELACIDDMHTSTSADLLSAWCTTQLLRQISTQLCRD
jgi:hypothetical protein